MKKQILLSLTFSLSLAACGKDEAVETEKQWKAYEPPMATGALTDSGALVPEVGTGAVKQ